MTRLYQFIAMSLVVPLLANALVIPETQEAALKRFIDDEQDLIATVVRQVADEHELDKKELFEAWEMEKRNLIDVPDKVFDTRRNKHETVTVCAPAATTTAEALTASPASTAIAVADTAIANNAVAAPLATVDTATDVSAPATAANHATSVTADPAAAAPAPAALAAGSPAANIIAAVQGIKAKVAAAKAAKAAAAARDFDTDFEPRALGIAAKVKAAIAKIKAKVQAAKAAKAAAAGAAVSAS